VLVGQPGQGVSLIARRLRRPESVASESLRLLESRGLLAVRRVGRRVEYRLGPRGGAGGLRAGGLVAALELAFRGERDPVEVLFRGATAFTHPRRIAIFRALQAQPRTLRQIEAATGIPQRALGRHLTKLEARGFVRRAQGRYRIADRVDAFGRELARLALA